MTALERARSVVAAWDEELRRELPENAYLFDVHRDPARLLPDGPLDLPRVHARAHLEPEAAE